MIFLNFLKEKKKVNSETLRETKPRIKERQRSDSFAFLLRLSVKAPGASERCTLPQSLLLRRWGGCVDRRRRWGAGMGRRKHRASTVEKEEKGRGRKGKREGLKGCKRKGKDKERERAAWSNFLKRGTRAIENYSSKREGSEEDSVTSDGTENRRVLS